MQGKEERPRGPCAFKPPGPQPAASKTLPSHSSPQPSCIQDLFCHKRSVQKCPNPMCSCLTNGYEAGNACPLLCHVYIELGTESPSLGVTALRVCTGEAHNVLTSRTTRRSSSPVLLIVFSTHPCGIGHRFLQFMHSDSPPPNTACWLVLSVHASTHSDDALLVRSAVARYPTLAPSPWFLGTNPPASQQGPALHISRQPLAPWSEPPLVPFHD